MWYSHQIKKHNLLSLFLSYIAPRNMNTEEQSHIFLKIGSTWIDLTKGLEYWLVLPKTNSESVLLCFGIKLERKYKFKLLCSSTFKLIMEKAATKHISQVL